MPSSSHASTNRGLPSFRERLKGLMAFRVATVTFLLGGMIVAESRALSSLSEPTHLALLGLIILTYCLTIVYGLALDRVESLHRLARIQIGLDVMTTSLLVLLTSGLDSLFIFLFYINIISAAIVVGRRLALLTATGVSLFIVGLGTAIYLGLTHPLFEFRGGPRLVRPLYFEVAVNCAAAFMVAFLAGDLSDRLGRTRVELERKELDLQTLRTLTQNIVASLNSGLLTVDAEGEVIFFNRAATAITGVNHDEVVGRPLESVFPDLADVLESRGALGALDDVESTEASPMSRSRFECPFTREDGETIYLGFSVSILRDNEGVSFGRIVVFQDLTDIKKLEAEKKRSERMAAVGELAASIAHEIRNPLASISGSVEMLKTTSDLDDSAQNLMDIVLREVDRLDTLIEEFLDYSRPSSLNREPIDLKSLVGEVLELFEEGEEALEIEFDVEATEAGDEAGEPDWEAPVDREALRQMLWNLLNNAAEAVSDVETPRIRVELERFRRDDRSRFSIAVEDNGPGIDEEHEERIFDPFFTTREEGSGLGLATTHQLVEAHGGRIQLDDSDTLGGARFTVILPESPEPSSGTYGLEFDQEEPAERLDTTGAETSDGDVSAPFPSASREDAP